MNNKRFRLRHDGFSRSMLRDRELLIAFLKMVLSRKLFSMLDLDTVELSNESYFNKGLYDFNNGRDLTPTVPILIQHGKKKWNILYRFRMCFSKFFREVLGAFIPDFDYITVNMNDSKHDNISNPKLYLFVKLLGSSHGDLRGAFMTSLSKIAREASPGEISKRYSKVLEDSIEYISGSTEITPEEIDIMISILEKENKELATELSTLADKMEIRGIKKGINIGKEEGKEEERLTIAKTMKEMGISSEQIMNATKLSEEDVNKL